MIVTPIRNTYKAVEPIREKNAENGFSFADLMGQQARGKANDNPAIAVTRTVPQPQDVNGQFLDILT